VGNAVGDCSSLVARLMIDWLHTCCDRVQAAARSLVYVLVLECLRAVAAAAMVAPLREA
jgi:hypothetical protein